MMSEQTLGHQKKTQTGGSSDACTTQDDGEMKLTLLYQDDWLVAVNKPSGLLVHRSWLDKAETRFAMQMTRDLIGASTRYTGSTGPPRGCCCLPSILPWPVP